MKNSDAPLKGLWQKTRRKIRDRLRKLPQNLRPTPRARILTHLTPSRHICLLACLRLLTCCQKINKNLIPSQPAIVPASRGFFTKIVHDMTAGRRARRASSQPATSQPFYLFASFFFFGNKIKAPAHTHAIPLSSSTGRGSGSWEGSHHWKVRTTA